LPAEAQERVFKIGERLDDQVPGSGLGLPIVRDLARLYGGEISLNDSTHGGLRATLTLPAARARASGSDSKSDEAVSHAGKGRVEAAAPKARTDNGSAPDLRTAFPDRGDRLVRHPPITRLPYWYSILAAWCQLLFRLA
jgi:hypothetical protein